MFEVYKFDGWNCDAVAWFDSKEDAELEAELLEMRDGVKYGVRENH